MRPEAVPPAEAADPWRRPLRLGALLAIVAGLALPMGVVAQVRHGGPGLLVIAILAAPIALATAMALGYLGFALVALLVQVMDRLLARPERPEAPVPPAGGPPA